MVKEKRTLEFLSGKCIPAGARARSTFSRLLGLGPLAGRYRVTAVAWMDRALEVAIGTADGQQVLRIERRTGKSAGLAMTPELVLYFRGKDVPAELAELVSKAAGKSFAKHTIESLAELLLEDPELGDPAQPLPSEPQQQEDKPSSLLDSWGSGDAWADFLAWGELAREQLDSMDPGNIFSFIQHSDTECLHVNPHTGGSVVWLINHPWENRIRHGESSLEKFDVAEALEQGMITSELDEDDIVLGNPDKLKRLLAAGEKIHRRTGKPLFFSNTCTPVVIGEDVESEVKRFARRSGCPILYLTVTPRSMVNVFNDVLVKRRLRAEREIPESRPNTVNLVGFRQDPELEHLRSLLGACGIAVNVALIPELTYELVDNLPRAGLNVLYPNAQWQHLYEQLMYSSRLRSIQPPAPFGISGTLDWLESVRAELGMNGPLPEDVLRQAGRAREAIERMAGRIARCRLGIVVRSSQTRYLSDPSQSWGVPLVGMLEELGFGLDVFVKVTGRKDAAIAAREIQSCFGKPERHVIKAFKDFDGMLERIRASSAQAFFSAHFFDWRLTSCGKGIFSLQHFEMGFRGAVRTAERLVRVCSTPFFSRLSGYLRRGKAGTFVEGEP